MNISTMCMPAAAWWARKRVHWLSHDEEKINYMSQPQAAVPDDDAIEGQEKVELVQLTIDGRPVRVPKGSVIWAAAKQLGIEIPIYCYHPKMEPLGACRMCFVAVENMPKLATACTTTVAPGMVVHTDTPAVKKARQGTLEFLLINHPLDCPICDKGGECDLQDFTLRHGPETSRFDLSKRHFQKPIPVSEHILLDRERCIACQRCVRFCQTVAMEDGLIMKERAFRTEVGVDPEAPFDSIFSGNVVEMCPVGALTARSYRFVSRPWELRHTGSICGNCAVGCNVRVDVRVDKVLRQYSRTNDDVDNGWLCDRGRWDLDRVNSQQRLRTPLIRRAGKGGAAGELQPASWEEALTLVARRLREISEQSGAASIGGIGSTQTTNEEAYLFQKLLRAGLGTNNIDHRHGRFPAPDPETTHSLPWVWSDSIAGLDRASHIVLFGADPYHRQPIIDLRIRQAIRNGARVYLVTSLPNRLDRLASGTFRYTSGQIGLVARALLQAVAAESLGHGDFAAGHPSLLSQALAGDTPERAASITGIDAAELRALAREIGGAQGVVLLYDEMATLESSGANLAADLLHLALLTNNFGRPGAGVGPLLSDSNSLGARDMGLLPDMLPGYRPLVEASTLEGIWGTKLSRETGMSYDEQLSSGLKALYVMGANPAAEASAARVAALESLDFLVVQDLFLTETAQHASVVLPAVAYVEKDGTFTSTERRVQVVRQAMQPLPGARADWEILRGVGRALGLPWNYTSPGDILREIGRAVPIYTGASRQALGEQGRRWPLTPRRPSGATGAGRPGVKETPFLTWQMLESGLAPGVPVGEGRHELAAQRGQGE
jgi:NADH-quinone oxidoreductase chain G